MVKLGVQAKRSRNTKDVEAAFREMNDMSILRLFESFIESAPQLILQLYIILTTGSIDWVIGKTKSSFNKSRSDFGTKKNIFS